LFTALNDETVIITTTNPSFTTYNSLEQIYSTTLQCPCSNKAISQQRFMSFSPTFHQICSSGFIGDAWIQLLNYRATDNYNNDWFTISSAQFQLLADLCDLVNKTINDAARRFLSQIFIASSVINQDDFNKQINASVNQFYQSTLYNFNIQKDIVYLIIQIDQFYMALSISGTDISDPNLILNINNVTDNYTIGNVCAIA